jgi:hypothetical protein
MQPGVLLIVCLLSWYLAAMVIYWYCLGKQYAKKPQVMEVPFALKEGQTILGIEDTAQGMDFYIGNHKEKRRYFDC